MLSAVSIAFTAPRLATWLQMHRKPPNFDCFSSSQLNSCELNGRTGISVLDWMRKRDAYSTRSEPQEPVPEDISLTSTTASHQQEDTSQEKAKHSKVLSKRRGFDFCWGERLFWPTLLNTCLQRIFAVRRLKTSWSTTTWHWMITTFLAIWSRQNEPTCRHQFKQSRWTQRCPRTLVHNAQSLTPCLNFQVLGSLLKHRGIADEPGVLTVHRHDHQAPKRWRSEYILKLHTPKEHPWRNLTTKRAARLRSSRCARILRLLSAVLRLKNTQLVRTSRAVQSRKERPPKLCNSAKTRTSRTAQPAWTDILSWAIPQRTHNFTCHSTHTFACSPGTFCSGCTLAKPSNSLQAFQPITENVGLIRLDVLGRASLRPQADDTTRFLRDCNVGWRPSCQVAADLKTDSQGQPIPICDSAAFQIQRCVIKGTCGVPNQSAHPAGTWPWSNRETTPTQNWARRANGNRLHPYIWSSEYNGHLLGQLPVHTALTFTQNMSPIE